MSRKPSAKPWSRRTFLKTSAAGLTALLADPFRKARGQSTADSASNPVYWVDAIPDNPFGSREHLNYHAGLETILALMGRTGLKFYRSSETALLSGPDGLIAPEDVVLIKVNAQWKYRGCTNSDLVRGLVQRVLDYPGGFRGEVVIFENGQGRGSLNCDTRSGYRDDLVHANANDTSHSFLYLVDTLFKDPRVSAKLLDPFGQEIIAAGDHLSEGYRRYKDVSYPCFNTTGGRRVELKEGVWNGSGHGSNLKLINVPVLKHHDVGGSEITACLKHMYGVLSMYDRSSTDRHYKQLGSTVGTMFAEVRTPVLNILDAIWVSHLALTGYPASATFRANQLLAGQDPVALDHFAAKHILYPYDENERHHPDFIGIDYWLTQAAETINARPGGLFDPASGIRVREVTKDESRMRVFKDSAVRSHQGGIGPRSNGRAA